MTEDNNTPEAESGAGASLSDEEKNEFAGAIANDIYKKSTFAQVIQLVQTQCTNQAATIVENATAEEIDSFRKHLAAQAAPEAQSDPEAESAEETEDNSTES
jgi:hypothetical protein